MAPRQGKEFRAGTLRVALTSGLTRKQVAEDLGAGFSTLNRWVQKDQDDALMSGPHCNLETRIYAFARKSAYYARRGKYLKRRPSSLRVKNGTVRFH